jgi:hypothetical protein
MLRDLAEPTPQDIVARRYDAGAGFAAWAAADQGFDAARAPRRAALETIEEPEGPATFLWVLARCPE